MILKSEGNSIRISILRRKYPESIEFEDANWLEAEIEINVPSFRGLYGTNLRVDDFVHFNDELEKVKKNESQKAEFTTMEEGLYLKGMFDISGNMKWEGIARSSWGNSYLTFFIDTDYMSIDDLIRQTCEILIQYPVIGE